MCRVINVLQCRSVVCEDSGFVKDVIKKESHSDLERLCPSGIIFSRLGKNRTNFFLCPPLYTGTNLPPSKRKVFYFTRTIRVRPSTRSTCYIEVKYKYKSYIREDYKFEETCTRAMNGEEVSMIAE